MINDLNISELREQFSSAKPFQHVIIDDFFDEITAREIVEAFPNHDDTAWTVSYNNAVENKKACSHWDKFPAPIYNSLFYLCSAEFLNIVESITQTDHVMADYGLHGGGMHSHNQSALNDATDLVNGVDHILTNTTGVCQLNAHDCYGLVERLELAIILLLTIAKILEKKGAI